MRGKVFLGNFLCLVFLPLLALLVHISAIQAEVWTAKDVDRVVEKTAEGELQVGLGQATIAPPWPVKPSYGKQVPTFEFYGPEIYAKALVMKVKGLEIALVECDVIGIRAEDAEYIKTLINKETGMPKGNIILAATHNHSFPRVYEKRVREWVAIQTAKAVKRAQQNYFKARIGFGMGVLPAELTCNRHTTVNGYRNTHLYVVRIDDANGDLRAVLFNFGSHPNIFTTAWGEGEIGKFGPGWPGYARKYIECAEDLKHLFSQYEKGRAFHPLFTIFSLGAAGDQQPSLSWDELDGKRTPRRKVFVVTLAKKVMQTVEKIETTPKVKVVFKSKVIEIPLKQHIRWRREPRTLIQALIINHTAIGVIPGELSASLGAYFEENSGHRYSFVITVANDYIGYLTPEAEAIEEVTYEGKGSAFKAERGRIVMNQVLELVNPQYTPLPPVDPAKDLGKIVGRVKYSGKHKIVVGVMNDAHDASTLPRFWGKRAQPDSAGRFTFENMAPGVKFLYVKEVADNYAGKAGSDLQTLLCGQEVLVTAGKTTTVEIDAPLPKRNIKSVKIDTASIKTSHCKISGRLVVEGELKPGETVFGGVFNYGIQYQWHRDYYLKNPLRTTKVDQSGKFRFKKVPKGKYVFFFWFDTNNNGRVESPVDITSQFVPVTVK